MKISLQPLGAAMLFPPTYEEKNMGISVKNLTPSITYYGSIFSFLITDDKGGEWNLSVTQQTNDQVFNWVFYLKSPTGHEWDHKSDIFPRVDGSCGFDLDSPWDVLMLMGILKHDGVSRKKAA